MRKQNDDFNARRRTLIRKGIASAAVGAVAASGVLKFSSARAQSKVSKSAAMYQDKPNGAQQCSKCMFFVPGKTPTADGTCNKVEGVISPHGWCGLFVAKS